MRRGLAFFLHGFRCMVIPVNARVPEPVALVGGAFLRARPRVVAPLVLFSAVALRHAGVPVEQQAVLGAIQGGMVAFFCAEAWQVRRRAVSARWLATSLAITVLGLGAAVGASGGLGSPVLPMLFAPLGVSMAAFGRGRLATAVLGLGGLVVLLWWGAGPLFPAPPEPWRGRMTAACAAGAAALLWMGVGGLADAHRGAVRSLELAGQGLLEEAAAKMRSLEQVGARVAHEVKNPLASVKGLAALLAEGEADPRRQRRFEVLQGEVERIEKILGDYLSFSRPMEGLREGEFALDELARALVEVLDGRARRQDAVVVAAGGELSLRGDRARLFEALLNLTSNALEAGARRVELRWGIAGAGVRVQVRDDGRGMGPEELARLGTPFHTTREGGTGLGVVLARAAVRQHGGELTFESAPGQGTTVTLMFPGERAIHGDHRAG